MQDYIPLYAEFHRYYKKYLPLKKKQSQLLELREELFDDALPSSIRYDRERVQVSGCFNRFDKYIEALEEKDIDAQLEEVSSKIKELAIYMKPLFNRLIKSDYLTDMIYLQYHVEHKSMQKVADNIGVSKSTVCIYNKQIKEELAKV